MPLHPVSTRRDGSKQKRVEAPPGPPRASAAPPRHRLRPPRCHVPRCPPPAAISVTKCFRRRKGKRGGEKIWLGKKKRAAHIFTALTRLPFGSLRALSVRYNACMDTSLFLSLCAMPVCALPAALIGSQNLQVRWFGGTPGRVRDAGQILLCRRSGGLAFARYIFRP